MASGKYFQYKSVRGQSLHGPPARKWPLDATLNMYVYIYTHSCVCMHVCAHVCMCMCICISTCICICICICMCVYVYVYVHVYVYAPGHEVHERASLRLRRIRAQRLRKEHRRGSRGPNKKGWGCDWPGAGQMLFGGFLCIVAQQLRTNHEARFRQNYANNCPRLPKTTHKLLRV